MMLRPTSARGQALLTCATAALTIIVAAALFSAAALAHAPAMALPLLVVVCIGGPVLAAFELRRAIATLRAPRSGGAPLDTRALAALRRQLDQLPEAQHPLGL
jgi:hypothetical protein